MIHIIIPTFRRLNNPITLNSIPEKFREQTTLVVQPQEADAAREVHLNVWVTDGDNIGIAKTREQVSYEWGIKRKSRFWVIDDDCEFMLNTPKETFETDGKVQKSPITEKSFGEMLDDMEEAIDAGYAHGGIGTTINNPVGKYPHIDNSRLISNVWYDGAALCEEIPNIDWILDGAEDYYVNIQLLTKGYPNRVIYKYVVNPGVSQAEGGCSEYRDIEFHNEACRKLARAFPEFVSITEKETKSGPWKGVIKLGINGKWKKAYQYSQVSTLNDFFT